MDNIYSTYDENIQKLAQWLQDILYTAPAPEHIPTLHTQKTPISGERDIQLELLLQDSSYHKRFFQQIPDFVFALLQNDPQAATHYAPLLYHLAGCSICHQSYLEVYDAMRAAASSSVLSWRASRRIASACVIHA